MVGSGTDVNISFAISKFLFCLAVIQSINQPIPDYYPKYQWVRFLIHKRVQGIQLVRDTNLWVSKITDRFESSAAVKCSAVSKVVRIISP